MLFASAAIALADPPPGCTTADLARVQSGVSAATSDYLFSQARTRSVSGDTRPSSRMRSVPGLAFSAKPEK